MGIVFSNLFGKMRKLEAIVRWGMNLKNAHEG